MLRGTRGPCKAAPFQVSGTVGHSGVKNPRPTPATHHPSGIICLLLHVRRTALVFRSRGRGERSGRWINPGDRIDHSIQPRREFAQVPRWAAHIPWNLVLIEGEKKALVF